MRESASREQEIDKLSKKADELSAQELGLSNRHYIAPDGHATCLDTTTKQHANDPIPIAVQFSINHDGTFQYEANDMGLSGDALFEKIYE
jgi:hypothetical protein